MSNNSGASNGIGDMNNWDKKLLIIVLATVIPVIILLIIGGMLVRRTLRRRRLFNRGITPINDEEIESWKLDRNLEKEPVLEPLAKQPQPQPQQQQQQQQQQSVDSSPASSQHRPSQSIGSIRKPLSVIVYSNPSTPAYQQPAMPDEAVLASPRYLQHKRSLDIQPSSTVLARAPNSRPGLTDETVQGDDAYVPSIKRHPSRLNKLPPGSPRTNGKTNHRTRSSQSSSASASQYWHGQQRRNNSSSRQSLDQPRTPRSLDIRRQPGRMHSSSNPPRLSVDEDLYYYGGLSPRPTIHLSEIGRAIG